MNKNLETTIEGLKELAKDCGEFARAHGGQALKVAEEQGIKISSGIKAGMKAGAQAYKETQGSRDPDGFGTADFGKYSDISYGCEEKSAEAGSDAGVDEKEGTGEDGCDCQECNCKECKCVTECADNLEDFKDAESKVDSDERVKCKPHKVI